MVRSDLQCASGLCSFPTISCTARVIAEAGCSANEIQAITGRASSEEVARYTRAAEQKKLARAAIDRLTGPGTVTAFPNLGGGFGKNAKKDNEINDGIAPWRPVGGSVN